MPRLRRPSLSFNRATFERLAYYVEVYCQGGTNRTAVADEAINKYLDARGVPRSVPDTNERKANQAKPVTPKPVDGECSGVHLLG